MTESANHREMKYKIAGIARKFGYKCQVEMQSPVYMSFITNNQKQYIDVWCEYSRIEDGVIWGRQIPIEVYYSEQIKNIILDPRMHSFWVDPSISFRIIVSNSVEGSYTIPKDQTKKYFDLHLIPWNNLEGLITCLTLGKKYLVTNFETKMGGTITNVVGIKHRDIKKICEIWDKLEIGTILNLQREYGNNYDSNAVKVMYDKNHIGYVPRDDAKDLACFMDAGNGYLCNVDSKFGHPADKPILVIKIFQKEQEFCCEE